MHSHGHNPLHLKAEYVTYSNIAFDKSLTGCIFFHVRRQRAVCVSGNQEMELILSSKATEQNHT